MERTEEALRERVRETPLSERLTTCEKYIASMCAERRPPKMTIPLQHYDEDFYIYTTLADAQATIAALQADKEEWVKSREHYYQLWMQATDERDEMRKERDEFESQLTQRTAELDAAKAIQAIDLKNNNAYREQVANLQAELERVRGQYAELGKMVLALPKVEREIYEAVASYRYDKAPEAWFHCENQLIALLKHRQGMEG